MIYSSKYSDCWDFVKRSLSIDQDIYSKKDRSFLIKNYVKIDDPINKCLVVLRGLKKQIHFGVFFNGCIYHFDDRVFCEVFKGKDIMLDTFYTIKEFRFCG